MPLLFDFINRQFITFPPEIHTSFANRTVIVTGASSGLGFAATGLLTSLGASRIILAVRNQSKGEEAISSIRSKNPSLTTQLEVWPLDLSSFASVLTFADRAANQLPRLDALIANAGVWPHKYRKTQGGHEEALQTNVLATALLACALHPKLKATAREHGVLTHITFTGSELYEFAAFKERKQAGRGGLLGALDDKEIAAKRIGDRYHTTKLLVMLVAKQMAALAPLKDGAGVVINVNAPGMCYTQLGQQDMNLNVVVRKLIKTIARDPEVGARTLAYGACAPASAHGGYLPDCKLTELKGLAAGPEGKKLQEKAWTEIQAVLEGAKNGVTGL